MKNILTLIIIILITTSCSKTDSELETYQEVNGTSNVDDPKPYQTPNNSKIWDIMSGHSVQQVSLMDTYRNEKNEYKNALHYENTMDTWHMEILKHIDALSLDEAKEILDDMDSLPTNLVSYDTYYSIVRSFPEIENRRTRLQNFSDKNLKYLNNAKWKNENLRKNIIKGIMANQMMSHI